MRILKLIFLFCILILSSNLSYADEGVANEAPNYFNDGVKAQRERRYDDAEKNYTKTLIVDPSDKRWPVLITNNRGVILMESGDINNAEKMFKEALRLDPNFVPAQVNLGLIVDRRGNELDSMKYWLNFFGIDLAKIKPKKMVVAIEEKSSEANKDSSSNNKLLW